MGTEDEVFQMSHLTEFHEALLQSGVRSEKMAVLGLGHSFDIWAEIGGLVDKEVLGPAVEWVVAFASGGCEWVYFLKL